uniref:cytochrome P450 93A3-like n=1 Tax=Erigeron canadensis TaxID=72917 RepID=UPI001CB8D7FF|nr:cytochrome P450 93A3-like [Erigeron canadensis]
MADFEGYLVIFLLGVISAVFVKVLLKSNPAKCLIPPTPFALPIIGHLHLLGPKPHQVFHKLSVRYGPVFRLFLGSVPCVIFTSSESAKELFKTSDSAFLNRPHNSCMDYISYGGNSIIFAPYGSYWKFLKKTVMSELLNARTLDSLLPVRRDELNRFITFLSRKAKDGKPVELQAELMNMTNNVISRMLIGKRCTTEGDDGGVIRRIVTDIGEVMGIFNLSDHIWFFKNLDVQGVKKRSKEIRARFDSLIEKIIKEHEEVRKEIKKKGEVLKDLLDILLDISENEGMEIKLTREHVKAFILDIMGAGTHSSAITTEWALAELINHPKIMKKAVEEIDQVVGKNRLLQEADIPNLPYLQAIVKESLRLHPAAPVIQRQSIVDCTVGGYKIPAKTTIFFNVWSLGRDPTYWESPLEFRPERFAEKQMDVKGQNFQLLPFGSGRRMCPGTSLALMVIHVTLGSMIQCFEWKAGWDGNQTSVDMEEGTGITIPRANPLVCIPAARIDPVFLCM